MLKRFFDSQTRTIGAAAGILAVSALFSRILGLIREGLLASTFGAGPDLDIYFASFRIPDFVYNILIAGGIVVAFLPLFSEYFANNKEEAWKLTNNILNVFLLLMIVLCIGLFIFTPLLLRLVAPGFNLRQIKLATTLARLMFLSPIIFGLSSIFSGILQYFNRFLVYSLCPILYNLGIIFGIIFLAPSFGVLGVAIGVILGAALHLLVQIPSAISCGFRYRPILNFRHPGIKKIFILMLPRAFGAGAQQINLIVVTAIASTLPKGSITIFNFANNLQYFPIGIIGVSFAVASFPRFARLWQEGRNTEFVKSFSSVFRQIFYLIIPVSVLMFALKAQIVRIILQHGNFSQFSSQLTAASLGLFCLGIFALSLIPLIFRAFFSSQDTKTPTIIAVFAVFLNIILSLALTWLLTPAGNSASPFLRDFGARFQEFVRGIFSLWQVENISVLGLPLAFSSASIFQFVLLVIFLYKKVGDFMIGEILNSFLKVVSAGALMAISVYFILYLTNPILNARSLSGSILQILISVIIGVTVYLLTTVLFRSLEPVELWQSFLRKKEIKL